MKPDQSLSLSLHAAPLSLSFLLGAGFAAAHTSNLSMMASYSGKGAPSNGSVYICNLPPGTDEDMLAEHFGTIGLLKKDRRTGRPKVWLYRDKVTDEPKGDATVTYEDPHAALAAVEWFNNKDFHGMTIGVFMAESKSKDDHSYSSVNHVADPSLESDFGGPEESARDLNEIGGRGRGRGDASGKAWQQEGDWQCPNTSCTNVNFAFRGVCNRCGSARPSGGFGGGAGAGGRGRGRGSHDSSGPGRAPGAQAGLFGPNDWPCPIPGSGVRLFKVLRVWSGMELHFVQGIQCWELEAVGKSLTSKILGWLALIRLTLTAPLDGEKRCGNINWAKRLKCNICNTNKPGTNEGGVRGGRAGGYKELDEEEIEETRRRRREAEADDGELYDEFGNLKKKFRAKTQQSDAGQVLPGVGRAGWEVEELGIPNGCLLFVGNLVVVLANFFVKGTPMAWSLGPCFYGTVHDLPCFNFLTKGGVTEMEEKEAETGESKAARIENEIIEIGPAAEVETGIVGKIEKESMTTIARETMGETETVIRTGAGEFMKSL
ncbi:hypothetical protein RHMOL_Rhmol09G0109600 [Rhododendron molle]|uniref:Uncharacterized protein n=1 Tax=Rhododendron molle TaxID=49168 RepID=A0ACC0MD90_RHOML|nr:hypothetical protein RHMOL_Rhmol09G0109600 [Rhododendron molle]